MKFGFCGKNWDGTGRVLHLKFLLMCTYDFVSLNNFTATFHILRVQLRDKVKKHLPISKFIIYQGLILIRGLAQEGSNMDSSIWKPCTL